MNFDPAPVKQVIEIDGRCYSFDLKPWAALILNSTNLQAHPRPRQNNRNPQTKE